MNVKVALVYTSTTPELIELVEREVGAVLPKETEVISYQDLIELGSLAAAREKGLVRSEGKEYVMQDGDVVLFRFNV